MSDHTDMGAAKRMLGETRPRQPMAADKMLAKNNVSGGPCLQCSRPRTHTPLGAHASQRLLLLAQTSDINDIVEVP
eukprot:355205-Chlamydomonas_euryale.AAC.5